MRIILVVVVLLLSTLAAPAAKGAAFDWSFEIWGDADIAGPPGSSIGWGYMITNDDPLNWLVLTALDADLFQFGTPSNLFDFPIVPPGVLLGNPYFPEIQLGLYELTWNPDAPLGFTNSGRFILTAEWYDGDPLAGGVPLGLEPTTRSADYSATVGPAIPEPALAPLAGLVLAAGALARRKRA